MPVSGVQRQVALTSVAVHHMGGMTLVHRIDAGHRRASTHLLVVAVALSMAVAGWALVGLRQTQAQVTAQGLQNQKKYLGTWNYEQPDRETMRNVAVLSCRASTPGCPASGYSLQLPQIGWIVFSPEAGGGIVGHTDQGCEWHFRVDPSSLELNPASQYCFNHVINSGYTISRWSVTVSGRHEHETVVAVSHHPEGDYDFVLQDGSRTEVGDESWRQAIPRFAGDWSYDPADPRSIVNIVVTQYPLPGGQVQVVQSPEAGVVTFARDRDHEIAARTNDECRWTLAARGNTAELDPALQTCRLSDGSTRTLTFWSIVSDGKHQASVMAGIDQRGGRFLLGVGSLTRL
jgi:hypothetical protein